MNAICKAKAATLALAVGVLCAAPTDAAEIFGPGTVSCIALDVDRVDCLISASRITPDNRNEATFSLGDVPPGERSMFRKWCLNPGDSCSVTIQGQRASAQSDRLVQVTSLRWQRPQPPKDEAAAAR